MISIAIEAKSVTDLVDQLRSITNDLARISAAEPEHVEPAKPEEPAKPQEQTKPEPVVAPVTIKPEDVRRALNHLRSIMNEQSVGSGTAKVRELFTALGVSSFSEIDAEDYDRLMDMTAVAIKEAKDAAN